MAKKNEKKLVEEVEKKQNTRRPCCDKDKVRRGAWTPQEDKILVDFIRENGHVIWQELPELAGLNRCGKSCRLRWTNYLRPDIKRGSFTLEEEYTISRLHAAIGSKWSIIAANLPGRTDNDIKNYWNSHLRRRFDSIQFNQPSFSSMSVGVNSESAAITRHRAEWELVRLEAEARLPKKVLPDQPSVANSEGDVFLRLWNSEVGISFQNINASMGDECSGKRTYRPTSQISLTKVGNSEVGNSFHSINARIGECSGTKTGSPASLTSLMTQVDSGLGSGFTTSAEPCKNLGSTDMACPKYMGNSSNYNEANIMAAYSNATKSYDLDDCEAMWNILLDFSNTGNDLELL